jgi:deoxyribodipyrimidine photolyase-like uncharacterized protein
MQNLLVKSMVIFCKSCRYTHKETKKFGFAFVWVFYDFLQILQDLAKTKQKGRIYL